jgi:hypothetical protein
MSYQPFSAIPEAFEAKTFTEKAVFLCFGRKIPELPLGAEMVSIRFDQSGPDSKTALNALEYDPLFKQRIQNSCEIVSRDCYTHRLDPKESNERSIARKQLRDLARKKFPCAEQIRLLFPPTDAGYNPPCISSLKIIQDMKTMITTRVIRSLHPVHATILIMSRKFDLSNADPDATAQALNSIRSADPEGFKSYRELFTLFELLTVKASVSCVRAGRVIRELTDAKPTSKDMSQAATGLGVKFTVQARGRPRKRSSKPLL